MDMLGGAAAGALAGAKKPILEKTVATMEEKMGDWVPAYLKLFVPVFGSAPKLLHACKCVVPADKQDEFDQGWEQYNDAKVQLANM